jgi:oxygen-independent coproporphyrinogen III oxidase
MGAGVDSVPDHSALFRSVPTVNHFLYPPLRAFEPAASAASGALPQRLALDRSNPSPYAVYVSIPYCRVRCNSCHCFKALLPGHEDRPAVMEDYLECVFRQIDAYAETPRFASARCAAIYIGGGTASLLQPLQAERLIHKLMTSFTPEPDCELDFEGNPDDFTREYLSCLQANGVTRLSIGYQSANPDTLRALNSPHKAPEGLRAVEEALAAGFHTVNVDLLLNVPDQTEAMWQEDVRTLIALGPQGIGPSDYIIFDGSASRSLITLGRLHEQRAADTAYAWYRWAYDELARHGYYEQVRGIFALPGHPYKYVDVSCTQNREILGLGAGAYSFIGRHQFEAHADPEAYKRAVRNDEVFAVATMSEPATDEHLMERYITHNFYGAALDRGAFGERFGMDAVEAFADRFAHMASLGLITIDDDSVRLTELGRQWRRYVYHQFRSAELGKVPFKIRGY